MAESLNIDVSKFVENPSKTVMAELEKKYAAHVLLKMLTEGLHADIKLQVQGSCVKAHRCVLAGASTVFHAMFEHEMKEQITSTVEIADMSMEGLQLFLVLLYICVNVMDIVVPEFEAAVAKHSSELIQAIHKYDVANKLTCIVARALPRVLTPDNCWDYCRITALESIVLKKCPFPRKQYSKATKRLGRLEFVCLKYIMQKFREVVISNATLQEMQRNPVLVWTVTKLHCDFNIGFLERLEYPNWKFDQMFENII